MTLDELKDMKLHEAKSVDIESYNKLIVVRVPAGWIYDREVFVPEPKEGEREGICIWKVDRIGDRFVLYKTACKREFSPTIDYETVVKYCPYCGRRIEVVK